MIKLQKLLILILFPVFTSSLLAEEDITRNDSQNADKNEKLIFVQLITRHGARAPFGNLTKGVAHQWAKNELKQLLPSGMRGEFNVGQKLRKRYVYNYKFLSSDYLFDSIYVVADDKKTILSASCLLEGLYPNGTGPKLDDGSPALPNYQTMIPVIFLPDMALMGDMKNWDKYSKDISYHKKPWMDMEAKISKKYERWSKIFNQKIDDPWAVIGVGGNLLSLKAAGYPLPEGLTQKDFDEIVWCRNFGMGFLNAPIELSYNILNKMFNEMADNLQKAVEGKMPYKLYYYSAHDFTLSWIMSLLGYPLEFSPDFSSHLELELWENIKTNQYTVRLLYNGNYKSLPIMNEEKSVAYDKFAEYIKSVNDKYGQEPLFN